MKFVDTLILVAFPLGLLMVAFGGMFLKKRILMPLGSLACAASMIPLGIRLLSTANQTLDYVCGGMALAAGIPLLVLGVLGAIGHLLGGQNRIAPTTAKP